MAKEPDFQLIETFLYTSEDGLSLLSLHQERMVKSGHFFDFKCNWGKIEQALFDETRPLRGSYRIRLLLFPNGQTDIQSFPLELPVRPPEIKVMLSAHRMQSQNIFLQHKTTKREIYESEFAHFSQLHGCGEVLFMNEKNELTEGCRSNLFLQRADSDLLITPPVTSGLLPGTLRADLLNNKKAVIENIRLDDLKKAKAIYFGNSVRGLQPAKVQI